MSEMNDRGDIEKKYGKKEDDLISRTYRDSKQLGDHWCVLNAQKYLKRFISVGSVKSNNIEDLLKAKDYIDRCVEVNLSSLIVDNQPKG
jgi:hypothetical protein